MLVKYSHNQKGMILPSVLMVFMILMTLGVTVIHISSADHRHSQYENNKMQAYYLAQSGAQTMATYLIEKSYHESFSNMLQLIEDVSNKTSEAASFQEGTLVIETVKKTVSGQEKLAIKSQGSYRGVSETVEVNLLLSIQSAGGDYNPSSDTNALVALSEDASLALELSSGAFLEGNVMLHATKENSIRFRGGSGYNIRNGSLFIPHGSNPQFVIDTDRGASNGDAPEEYKVPGVPDWQYYNNWAFWKNIQQGVKYASIPSYPSSKYPEPVFPAFPNINELPVPANPNYTTPEAGVYYPITEDGYYQSIEPSSSRTITVDLAGGDRIIRVGDLKLTGGNIQLANVGENGRLILYVDDSFSLGSSRSLNAAGLPENVHIYYAGTQTVVIDGASRFSGNIFVNEANLDFTAGAHMKGNITSLGENVSVSGGSAASDMILYAPKAHVEMGGSAQIKGSVIANSLTRLGGSNAGILFSANTSDIPGEFFGGGNNKIIIEYDQNPWR